MECDFVALEMRKLLPNVHSISPTRNTIDSSFKFLTYNRKHEFSACAALTTVEPTRSTSNSHIRESNREKPSNFLGPIRSSFISSTDKSKYELVDVREELKRFSGLLRDYATKGGLNEGKAIHGSLIKSGVVPDMHLWISLINYYGKCGCLKFSRKVFDEMPERDVVSWTALVSGFVSKGYGEDGVGMYCGMRREGIGTNEFALATVLKACSLCLDVEFGKQVHAEAIKCGLLEDLFVGSSLVDLYAKGGDLDLAERVIFEMPMRNSVSMNALLNGYAQRGDGEGALMLFSRMADCALKLCSFTFSAVLKSCASSGFFREGKVLHSLAIRNGIELDEFLGCSLLDMYCKCGMAHDALKVFKRIKNPDIVAWTAMISGLEQQGLTQDAANFFNLMRRNGIRPNQFSFSSLVSAATNVDDLSFGQSVHASIFKYGLEYDNSVSNALIMMYMKRGCVQSGIQVFDSMNNHDLVSWNAFLSGFVDLENCDQGPKIFYQMLVAGLKPNMYTFVSVLRSCSTLLDARFGKQVHAHIIKNSINDNDFVGTSLIDMYAKSKCLEDADLAFNRLINRDVFTWTVIIDGYAQTDQAEKAVKFLVRMQREGIKPNEFTIASCLSACSQMTTLESGQQLHSVVIKAGYCSDKFVSSAMVDMYAKCGCIEDAEAIFKGLLSLDTVLWNTIITAYSQHGKGEKALEAFRMMLDEGIAPDKVTFLSILSACSYMGFVEQGKEFFDSMCKVYGLAPWIEHYACMIDILGRVGKFDELENFLEEKKLASYPLIWETVLGACRLHGNVDLGQKAAMRICELEPNMDSNYILLSNIFATKGRWDEVKGIRASMSTQSVKKEPGCSWLEVDGKVHVFLSQDSSHPKIHEIHVKLEDLRKKLTSIGYVPKIENVLHNISDSEKEENLHHHSERLALAYALISTNPNKPVRIFKNLRICEDCHDVMKLISEITNREIVIRDIKRFHHFTRGSCSCHDFW